jgi:molybdate transport system substrate-binding protein
MTPALRAALALLLLVGMLVAAACGDDDSAGGDTAGGGATADLTVLAAASLTDVFPQIDPAPSYSFAGSDQLAAQIREGAPADVYAAANEKLPNELYADKLVDEPQVFATNTLVLIVPADNPKNIDSVGDLGAGGVTYVMAAEGVPVGDYTREILANLGEQDLIAGAASYEQDVRDVSSKVALGEADAGFVYATDAKAAGADVTSIPIPASAQPPIRYGIAVVSASGNTAGAQALVAEVLGPQGQADLEAAGFGPP